MSRAGIEIEEDKNFARAYKLSKSNSRYTIAYVLDFIKDWEELQRKFGVRK